MPSYGPWHEIEESRGTYMVRKVGEFSNFGERERKIARSMGSEDSKSGFAMMFQQYQ